MKNIHPLPDLRVIEGEACEWLIKLDRDEPLGREERIALREWLARSPQHRRELGRLNAFWSNHALTELVVPLDRPGPCVVKEKVWALGGLAAVIMMAIVAIAWYFPPRFDSSQQTNELYLTAVGQQKNLSLADGSKAQINTNTQIAVNYGTGYRNIHLLQGEAYFQVAKDARRPFRVYAGAGRIQAVGTAFIVHLDDEFMRVLVNEGHVAMASLARPATAAAQSQSGHESHLHNQPLELGILEAGESVTLNVADGGGLAREAWRDAVEQLEELEIARRQSWRNGLLVFTGEPLAQVVQEVSRYTTISIEIADPALGQLQIGGRFPVGRVEEMLMALEANFDLRVHWLGHNRASLSATK